MNHSLCSANWYSTRYNPKSESTFSITKLALSVNIVIAISIKCRQYQHSGELILKHYGCTPRILQQMIQFILSHPSYKRDPKLLICALDIAHSLHNQLVQQLDTDPRGMPKQMRAKHQAIESKRLSMACSQAKMLWNELHVCPSIQGKRLPIRIRLH